MNAFQESLLLQGVDLACERMGLDFAETFPDSPRFAALYQRHAWCVHAHHAIGLQGGVVIHAIPAPEEISRCPWEEWYCLNGELIHTCLYEHAMPCARGELFIGEEDLDHPIRVLGKTWYPYQAPSLLPWRISESENGSDRL